MRAVLHAFTLGHQTSEGVEFVGHRLPKNHLVGIRNPRRRHRTVAVWSAEEAIPGDERSVAPCRQTNLPADVEAQGVSRLEREGEPGGVAGQGGSVGGNRPRNNNFVVDGVDNNDPSTTGTLTPVIAEAVEEFTLLTNQFNAEYGHSTAGQFITTTRSGSNELHGRAWWYNQNRKSKCYNVIRD